jgi:hypothetical protein
MKLKFSILVVSAVLPLTSSLALAAQNECLVSIGQVGSNVQGVHGITVDQPDYDTWSYEGKLYMSGSLKDDAGPNTNPTLSFLHTSWPARNCREYKAETLATISGTGQTTFICGKSAFYTVRASGGSEC